MITLFEREDLAVAGTEERMRGIKHSEVLKQIDLRGTSSSLGRDECPESMYLRPVGWGAKEFPAHIAAFYPKPRVPRICLDTPNYVLIINETSAL